MGIVSNKPSLVKASIGVVDFDCMGERVGREFVSEDKVFINEIVHGSSIKESLCFSSLSSPILTFAQDYEG